MAELVQLRLFDVDAGQAAREARDDGMARATGHEDATWNAYARAVLRELAQQRAEVHTDDLAAVIVWHPRHPNAWGGVWRDAINAKVLVCTDRTKPSRDPRKHAHRYPIYASLVYGKEA